MQALKGLRRSRSARRRESESLGQNRREVVGFAVGDRVNENPPAGTFRHYIDSIQPTLGVTPCRFTVANHQQLIDPG
jgi:hypothetical protein